MNGPIKRDAPLITRNDKIRFAADCIRSGIEVERVARHLCVKPQSIYRWLGRRTYAQDDETGRIWTGPESMIPPGYSNLFAGRRVVHRDYANSPRCKDDTP